MQDMDFKGIIESVSGGNGQYTAEMTPNWQQGRTAFGGIVAALGYRAAALEAGTSSPVRSVMVNFIGPLGAGTCDIEVETLRTGKSVAQYGVTIKQDAAYVCQMTVVFGAARDGAVVTAEQGQFAAPFEKLQDAPRLPFMPQFLDNFQVRWLGTGVPASGTRDTEAQIWARLIDGAGDYPVEGALAIADMPPPIMMSHYSKRIMASSMTWKLEFVEQPARAAGNWYYLDFKLEAAAEGYSQQAGSIYDESGKLVMLGHQCMAYFEPKGD